MHLTTLLPLLALTAPALATPSRPPQLATRATESTDGTLFCGVFASGDKRTTKGLLADLGEGGKRARTTFTVAAGACERVHCWDTTAVYVCNDDAAAAVVLTGAEVFAAADRVLKLCCQAVTSGLLTTGRGTSGQKFVRDVARGWNWNAVVAYGNCRWDKRTRPSLAGGWGVNPVCEGGNLNVYDS